MTSLEQKTDSIIEEFIRVHKKYGNISVTDYLAIRKTALEELRQFGLRDMHIKESTIHSQAFVKSNDGEVASKQYAPRSTTTIPPVPLQHMDQQLSPMEALASMKDQWND